MVQTNNGQYIFKKHSICLLSLLFRQSSLVLGSGQRVHALKMLGKLDDFVNGIAEKSKDCNALLETILGSKWFNSQIQMTEAFLNVFFFKHFSKNIEKRKFSC